MNGSRSSESGGKVVRRLWDRCERGRRGSEGWRRYEFGVWSLLHGHGDLVRPERDIVMEIERQMILWISSLWEHRPEEPKSLNLDSNVVELGGYRTRWFMYPAIYQLHPKSRTPLESRKGIKEW